MFVGGLAPFSTGAFPPFNSNNVFNLQTTFASLVDLNKISGIVLIPV